jgi:hypothetical protein
LGGRIYHAIEGKEESDILSNQDVQKLVEDISAKEKKIKSLEEKVEQVRDQRVVTDKKSD